MKVRRRPKRRSRKEVAAIDFEVIFRNNERKRCAEWHSEFNEPRTSTSTESKRQEPTENVSSTKESDVERPMASFPTVGLNIYDIAQKTIQYIQLKKIKEKPENVNADAGENLTKAESNFVVNLRTVFHIISLDPKLLQLKICLPNYQKEWAPGKNHCVFYRTNRTIRFTVCRIRNYDTRRVKETSVRNTTFRTTRHHKNAGRK